MHNLIAYNIKLYNANNGRVPFTDWLESLKDMSARFKIKIRLDRISLGNLGNYKSVGDGVLELKIDYGPGYRIYFSIQARNVILLLAGGDKASQAKDIKRAKSYLQDFNFNMSN
jgi:putative addiction module killer protein